MSKYPQPGHRNINEIIHSLDRPTLPPTSIQPKRRRRKILETERSRITTASILGILVGAAGHAIITKKT